MFLAEQGVDFQTRSKILFNTSLSSGVSKTDMSTKISNQIMYLRLRNSLYTIAKQSEKVKELRGEHKLLFTFRLVRLYQMQSEECIPRVKPHCPTISNIMTNTSSYSLALQKNAKKGILYNVLYCLVVFERAGKNMSTVHWSMKKQLSQVMARKIWQMCFPANRDVFNSQELLFVKQLTLHLATMPTLCNFNKGYLVQNDVT